MADIEGIARKLYNIIISPDTVTGLINGGLSVPLDYGYLIYGIFDTDTRYERETERIRMMTAIRHDILNYENIVNAVKLIFQLFNKYISESEQDRIYRSVVTSIVGRISTNIIASNIAKAVIEKTSFTYVVFKGKGNPIAFLSTILLFGGMAERSIRTSDKLRNEAPEVYSLLRPPRLCSSLFLICRCGTTFCGCHPCRVHRGQPRIRQDYEKSGRSFKYEC